MHCYCVKCKQKTDSEDEEVVKMKNGLSRISCKCKECGKNKSSILGKGLYPVGFS